MPLVTSGVDHGNLRELALKRMEELDLQCRDGEFVSSGGVIYVHWSNDKLLGPI